jgi:hypothetical protein
VLVVIPEEVELLLPGLRKRTKNPAVYLISYAAPVKKSMLCFNNFRYYTLPRLPADLEFPNWFRLEIGILAGRLYVDSDEVDSVARYPRSVSRVTDNHSSDGELKAANGAPLVRVADDAAAFVLEWLALRRRVQDVVHTPMGKLCMGRPLQHSLV